MKLLIYTWLLSGSIFGMAQLSEEDEVLVLDEGKFEVKLGGEVQGTEEFKLTKEDGDYYLEGTSNFGSQVKIESAMFRYDEKFSSKQVSLKIDGIQGAMKIKGGFRGGVFAATLGPREAQVEVGENCLACMSTAPFFAWLPVGYRLSLEDKEDVTVNAILMDQRAPAQIKFVSKGKKSVNVDGQESELYHFIATLEAAGGQGGGGATIEIHFYVDGKKRLMKIEIPAQTVEVSRKA